MRADLRTGDCFAFFGVMMMMYVCVLVMSDSRAGVGRRYGESGISFWLNAVLMLVMLFHRTKAAMLVRSAA